jgi:hypothetical protein
LLGHRGAGRHDHDFTGHLLRSRSRFYSRGRLVEGVEKIDALGEYRSLGALNPMTHELQLVGGAHKPAAKQVRGQTTPHLARGADYRYVHR